MAVSYTPTISVFGDMRVSYGILTMTSVTSGAVSSGLDIIYGGAVTILSATSQVPGFIPAFNRGSGATALNGMLQIKTTTAGDTFNVFMFGK
jgi:hypothetical protein